MFSGQQMSRLPLAYIVSAVLVCAVALPVEAADPNDDAILNDILRKLDNLEREQVARQLDIERLRRVTEAYMKRGKGAGFSAVHPASTQRVNEEREPRPSSEAIQAPSRRRPRFDLALVDRGREALKISCTQCHDADRALQKKKTLSGWRTTVRRMAAKPRAYASKSRRNRW